MLMCVLGVDVDVAVYMNVDVYEVVRVCDCVC